LFFESLWPYKNRPLPPAISQQSCWGIRN